MMHLLVPEYPANMPEPQRFGSISFTEVSDEAVWSKFGQFGIAVTFEWARLKRAGPVQYVDPSSAMFAILREDFRVAFDDMKVKVAAKYPDDAARQRAYWNKNMAFVLGARLWEQCLTDFEYMEPVDHAGEREWRIVNPLPGDSPSRSEDAIKKAKDPYAWFSNPNKLLPADVVHLVCPGGRGEELRRMLPPEFAGVEIREIVRRVASPD